MASKKAWIAAAIGVGMANVASAGPSYATVDFPGAMQTTLDGGPSPRGTMIGSYVDSSGDTHGFMLEKGIFTTFDPPGSVYTAPIWISPQGTIVGGYYDSDFVQHGFILAGGAYSVVDYPGAVSTQLDGISPSGEIVGTYNKSASDLINGIYHSFILSKGVFTSFDPPNSGNPPGSGNSSTSSVNPSGVIVGNYALLSPNVFHGFQLSGGTYTTIDYPNASSTFVGANNPAGTIVGAWTDASGNVHGFILSGGKFTSFDYPGADGGFTGPGGISANGVIVGAYLDSAGLSHGFVRTP